MSYFSQIVSDALQGRPAIGSCKEFVAYAKARINLADVEVERLIDSALPNEVRRQLRAATDEDGHRKYVNFQFVDAETGKIKNKWKQASLCEVPEFSMALAQQIEIIKATYRGAQEIVAQCKKHTGVQLELPLYVGDEDPVLT